MSASVRAALRKRYDPKQGWAILEEVRNKTGYGGGPERYVDALVMGVWPSRGLELHGFEIKSSRNDWLRERDNPEKAEAISRFCDRWWLAVESDAIVREGELPPTWGLLVLDAKTKLLRTATEAPKRDADPIDRRFLASMLRRAADRTGLVPADEVEALVQERVAQRVELEVATRLVHLSPDRTKLLDRLEAELGMTLGEWNLPKIKKAIALVHQHERRQSWVEKVKREHDWAQLAADRLAALIKDLRDAGMCEEPDEKDHD